RPAVLPNVATAREQGLDFEISTWQGLFLPKGTPEPIVRRLNQAVGEALDTPYVRERFEALGEEIAPPERRSPGYFAKFVAGEIARWSPPIKASGVSADLACVCTSTLLRSTPRKRGPSAIARRRRA